MVISLLSLVCWGYLLVPAQGSVKRIHIFWTSLDGLRSPPEPVRSRPAVHCMVIEPFLGGGGSADDTWFMSNNFFVVTNELYEFFIIFEYSVFTVVALFILAMMDGCLAGKDLQHWCFSRMGSKTKLRGFSVASEPYRQSGRRRWAKLVPTFADRGVSRG